MGICQPQPSEGIRIKTYLQEHKLRKSGKKHELVECIERHMHKSYIEHKQMHLHDIGLIIYHLSIFECWVWEWDFSKKVRTKKCSKVKTVQIC